MSLSTARRAVERSLTGTLWRMAVNSATPQWIRLALARMLVGRSIALEHGVGGLSASQLAHLVEDPEERMLIVGKTSGAQLLDLGSRNEALGIASLCRLAEMPEEASETFFQAVVLDKASTTARRDLALAGVALMGRELDPVHARALLDECLELLSRPANPYDREASGTAGVARQAVAALLAPSPGFDVDVAARLKDPALAPNLLPAIAGALRGASAGAAARFLTYLSGMSANAEQAVRFAEDCDASRDMQPSPEPPRSRLGSRISSRLKRHEAQIKWVVAVVAPVLAAVAARLEAGRIADSFPGAGIDPTVAIGALALLAAVHVLSVQLAAQRLPGPIAAVTVLPPLTVAAYLTGLAMLGFSVIGGESQPPDWDPSFAASLLLVAFILLVIAATTRSLGSTGVVRACEDAGRRQFGRARKTGRRAGKLHAMARDFQEVIDNHGSLRRFTTPEEAAHRYAIRASKPGFLSVDLKRLVRAANRTRWVSGAVRLDLVVTPGVPVTPGDEMASLVPLQDVQLAKDDLLAADRIFSVRDERALERFAELCVALCAQVPILVRGGDPGGARRVLQVLLLLLTEHLNADSREWEGYTGLLPLSPALQQVIDQSVADIVASTSEVEGDLLARMIGSVIDFARANDGVLMLLSTRLGNGATNLTHFGVLYKAGCQAAALNDASSLMAVQSVLHKLVGGSSDAARYANEVAGRLVMFCAAAAPRQSRAAWSRWWGTAPAVSPTQDHLRIALRIGAAALPVGNLSLATEVSIALRGQDFDLLAAQARDRDRAQFENFLSGLYGRLLGVDAEQRIANFIGFARELNDAITVTAAA